MFSPPPPRSGVASAPHNNLIFSLFIILVSEGLKFRKALQIEDKLKDNNESLTETLRKIKTWNYIFQGRNHPDRKRG